MTKGMMVVPPKLGPEKCISLYGIFSLRLFFGGSHLNVSTFGGLMTAYLVWAGLSYDTIGILRGRNRPCGLFLSHMGIQCVVSY